MSEIVQGTDKKTRIGDKIFVKYVTWDFEIYGTSTQSNFPYIRVIICKDRAANTVVSGDLPTTRLGKPSVSALDIQSDDCLGMDSTYPGSSDNVPAILKFTR